MLMKNQERTDSNFWKVGRYNYRGISSWYGCAFVILVEISLGAEIV
jgi:hypothetical protein